jgi:flagellar hook-associated protein 2
MAPVTTISGVSSGIDWQATVDALMKVEQNKVTLLENRQSAQQRKLDAWRGLNTRLLSFQSAMDSLEESSTFLSHSVSSGDATKVSASVGEGAVAGTYSVLVDQLASTARVVHGGVADSDSTAVNSSGADQIFAYTYGSGVDAVTAQVVVGSGATLQELRDLINNDENNPGVRASLLNDGTGGATAWHLVLSGQDSGAAHSLVVDDALTTLGDGLAFDAASFTTSQSAQNARFRVDGYPAASWMESSSNTVEDALEGLTLKLSQVSADPVQISVSRDDGVVKQKIGALVSSYNELVGMINTYTSYNSTSETMGVLLGDGSVNQLKRALVETVTRPFSTLPASAQYSSLSEIGIRSGAGGQLSVDDEKLSAALSANPDEVARLFTFSSASDNSAFRFFTRTAKVPAGDVAVSLNYDAAGVLTGGTLNGVAATVEGDLLSAAAGSELEGLRILFRDPGDGPGSRSGQVRLSHGAAASLAFTLGRLTDSEQGMVQYQTGRLESTVGSLTDAIERMNERLAVKKDQLTRQYLAMESALAKLQSQSSAVSSLSSSSSSQ